MAPRATQSNESRRAVMWGRSPDLRADPLVGASGGDFRVSGRGQARNQQRTEREGRDGAGRVPPGGGSNGGSAPVKA